MTTSSQLPMPTREGIIACRNWLIQEYVKNYSPDSMAKLAQRSDDEQKAEYEQGFSAADRDGDGLLKEDEFMDWQLKQKEDSIALCGDHIPMTGRTMKWFYDAYNKITPGIDGISK